MCQKCGNSFCNIKCAKSAEIAFACSCHVYHTWQETFDTVWKLSRLSGNFPYWLETFQTGSNLPRLSGKFPEWHETFQTLWKLSELYGNFPVWTKVIIDFFQTLLRLNYIFCWKPKLPIWLEKGNNFGRCDVGRFPFWQIDMLQIATIFATFEFG